MSEVGLGLNFFDTAEKYTEGRSEELIARAIGNREDAAIASKVCPRKIDHAPPIYAVELVAKAVDASLKRLCRDHIAVYQTHGESLPATAGI